jgi:hypothetical protein
MSRSQRLRLALRALGLRIRSARKWERLNRKQQDTNNVLPPAQPIARSVQYWNERL